jgi:LysM repeat protein
MKKKEISMIVFVLLVTILSMWVVWSSSNKNSNNNSNNAQIDNNKNLVSSNSDNPSKGPTVIDNKVGDLKESSATNSQTNSNSSQNTDAQKEQQNTNTNIQTKQSEATGEKDYTIYEVKKGDSLLSICKKYEKTCPTSVLSKSILMSNKLSNSSEVKEGMQLKIPIKYTKDGIKYTVKTGDTLYDIALIYFKDMDINETVNTITTDNFINNYNIRVGDELFLANATTVNNTEIPANSDTSKQVNSNSKKTNINYIEHTVLKGETIASISKTYDKYCPSATTAKIILHYNGLKDSNAIKDGMILKIPEEYITSGIKYTIKSGDTLSHIAQNYFKDQNMDKVINKIISDNFLSSHDIKIGDQLFISMSTIDNKQVSLDD